MPSGLGAGALIAIAAHSLLILALTMVMNWPRDKSIATSAELWSDIPMAAAPAQPPSPIQTEPTPPPDRTPPPKSEPESPAPSPDIALEKKRKEKEQQRQAEIERKAQVLKAQKEQLLKEKAEKQEEKEAEKRRAENLARITGAAKASKDPRGTGLAAQSSGPSASYAGRIKARIKPNIVYSSDFLADDKTAEVEVRLSVDGTILGRKLIKSSGARDWDDAVLRAIDRTEILPRDTDGTVPAVIIISFNRQDR